MGANASKRKRIALLILIILAASFFRLYQIRGYAIFLGDEGRDALVVKRMIVDRDLTLLGPRTSVGDLYLGPAYYYLMTLPLWLSRLDPVGPAIMVALLGVATVFLIYLIGQALFGLSTGLVAASLYAVSQPIIEHTRFSWNPNPMPFFTGLSIYAFLRLIKNQKRIWAFILGACLGVCLQLHYLGSIFILMIILLWVFSRSQIPRRTWLLALGAFLLVLSPFILFEFRHNFVVTRSFRRFIKEDDKLGFNLGSYFKRAGFVFWRLFSHFLAVDQRWLALVLVIGAFFGFFSLVGKNKSGRRLMFIWLAVGVSGAAFYTGDIHDHYLGFLFLVPFLLTALFLERLKKTKFGFLAVLLFLGIFAKNLLNLDIFVGRAPNNQIRRAKEIGEIIAQDARGSRFNLALVSPTNDFRAMNYRYFVEINDAQPEHYDNYSELETLYVIVEQEGIPLTDMTAWEIASFGDSETIAEWQLEESGFKILKLGKRPGKK
ncbi:MAG: glycosyltransferase family 39 protein [Candidatus Pacebacteria bacterium]|nr:glycosyltransferase family 39 protein [Candidatus Paceibacterota bacterium]